MAYQNVVLCLFYCYFVNLIFDFHSHGQITRYIHLDRQQSLVSPPEEVDLCISSACIIHAPALKKVCQLEVVTKVAVVAAPAPVESDDFLVSVGLVSDIFFSSLGAESVVEDATDGTRAPG